jgi:hypothetical protein
MKLPGRVYGICFLLVLLGPSRIRAQEEVDATKCFNDMLVQKYDFDSTESFKYASLAIINRDNYNATKTNVALTAVYGAAMFSGDYEHFQEERQKYFELRSLNIDQYRQIRASQRTLAPAAYNLISQCIRDTSSHYGFSFHYTLANEYDATLELYYHSTEEKYKAHKITHSSLSNAVIVGEKTTTQLFPDCTWGSWGCPNLLEYRLYKLRRINPNQEMGIRVDLDPVVATHDLSIPPLDGNFDPKTEVDEGLPVKETHDFSPASVINANKDLSDGSDRALWIVHDYVPGIIIGAVCRFDRSHIYLISEPKVAAYLGIPNVPTPYWREGEVWCYGRDEGGAQHIWVDVTFKKTHKTFTRKPWPYTEPKVEAKK